MILDKNLVVMSVVFDSAFHSTNTTATTGSRGQKAQTAAIKARTYGHGEARLASGPTRTESPWDATAA